MEIQAFLGYKVHIELGEDNSRNWKEVFQWLWQSSTEEISEGRRNLITEKSLLAYIKLNQHISVFLIDFNGTF